MLNKSKSINPACRQAGQAGAEFAKSIISNDPHDKYAKSTKRLISMI
jgi:hypothetical protein